MDASQINTPPWQDKALWLALLAPLLSWVHQKLGLQLDPSAVVTLVLPLSTYIVAHKWKTATLSRALIQADAPAPAAPPAKG